VHLWSKKKHLTVPRQITRAPARLVRLAPPSLNPPYAFVVEGENDQNQQVEIEQRGQAKPGNRRKGQGRKATQIVMPAQSLHPGLCGPCNSRFSNTALREKKQATALDNAGQGV
jgi:hypothetical protein